MPHKKKPNKKSPKRTNKLKPPNLQSDETIPIKLKGKLAGLLLPCGTALYFKDGNLYEEWLGDNSLPEELEAIMRRRMRGVVFASPRFDDPNTVIDLLRIGAYQLGFRLVKVRR